jgi:hypothetical protein
VIIVAKTRSSQRQPMYLMRGPVETCFAAWGQASRSGSLNITHNGRLHRFIHAEIPPSSRPRGVPLSHQKATKSIRASILTFYMLHMQAAYNFDPSIEVLVDLRQLEKLKL